MERSSFSILFSIRESKARKMVILLLRLQSQSMEKDAHSQQENKLKLPVGIRTDN